MSCVLLLSIRQLFKQHETGIRHGSNDSNNWQQPQEQ